MCMAMGGRCRWVKCIDLCLGPVHGGSVADVRWRERGRGWVEGVRNICRVDRGNAAEVRRRECWQRSGGGSVGRGRAEGVLAEVGWRECGSVGRSVGRGWVEGVQQCWQVCWQRSSAASVTEDRHAGRVVQ